MESVLEQLQQAAERKLRLFLPKAGNILESQAYHRFATGLRKTDFREVVSRLAEQGFLEMMDGKHIGSVVLVLKSDVESFARRQSGA